MSNIRPFHVILAITASLVLLSSNSSGQSMSISPLSGSPSYSYPISSWSSDGAQLSFGLKWIGNVTQKHFHDYLDHTEEVCPECPPGAVDRWYWKTETRQHGLWAFSVNGFVVQSLNSVNFRFDDGHASATWMTTGYDYCNRMLDLSMDDDLRDVIRLLRSDGSVLELYNEHKASEYTDLDDPARFTGKYFQQGVNAKGWAKVEFDTRYYPDAIKEIIDANGTPLNKYHPRIVRYYQGDGLEYVFREDAFAYGVYSESSTDPRDEAMLAAGPTVFLLEKIFKDHNEIVTFEYSKHYPDDADPEVSVGRPLLTRFNGHHISYGEGLVSVEAMGRLHQLIVWDQDWLECAGYSTTSTSFDPCGVASMRTRLGLSHRYDEQLADPSSYYHNAYGAVREIITPNQHRQKFMYAKREVQNKSYFDAYVLKKVETNAGRTDLHYYSEPSMNYVTPNREFYRSKIFPAEQNVVCSLQVYNPNGDLISKRDFSYTHAAAFTGVAPAVRRTWFTDTDYLTPDLDRKITEENYYWDSVNVDEFVEVTTVPYATSDLIHMYLSQQTTRLGDRWYDDIYTEFLPDATNRFVRLTESRETKVTDGLGPTYDYYYHMPRANSVHNVSKVLYEYTTEEMPNSLTTADAKKFFQTIVKHVVEKIYEPTGTSSYTLFGRTETGYKNLSYLDVSSVSIKDTAIDDYWTRRGLDSLSTSGLVQYYRSIETKTTAESRDVRLAPQYGLVDFVDHYDNNGNYTGGIDYTLQSTYTGGVTPITVPRGAVTTVDMYGASGTTTKDPNVKINDVASISYDNSYFRCLPLSITGPFGQKMTMDWTPGVVSATRFETDLTANGSEQIADLGFLSDRPTLQGVTSRFYNPVTSPGDIGSLSLSTTSTTSVDGRLTLSKNVNGFFSAMRAEVDTPMVHSWAPGAIPSGWQRDQPGIKLWKSHTKVSVFTETEPCAGGTTVSVTSAEYQNEELFLTKNATLPWGACDNGDKKRERWTSSINLTYVASDDDNLHDESEVDAAILRLVIVDYDFTVTTNQIALDLEWSWGTSSSYTHTEDVLWSDREHDSQNPLWYSVIEIPVPASVFTAMQSSNAGEEIKLKISLDPTNNWDDTFLAFACNAEDAAPRILCLDQQTAPAPPLKPDATTNDFTTRTIVEDQGLKTTSYVKIDDNASTGSTFWQPSLPSDFNSRYVAALSETDADDYKSTFAPIRTNPFTGTTPDITSVEYDARGSTLLSTNALAKSWEPSNHLAGMDTLIAPDGTKRLSEDTLETRSTLGLPLQGDVVARRHKSFNELGVPVTSYYDVWDRLEKVEIGSNPAVTKTIYQYDNLGRLSTITNGEGQVITRTYDAFNRLKSVTHPDFGTEEYRYNDAGQMRFKQTEEQRSRSNGEAFTYYQYDDLGRVILVGEAVLDASEVNYDDLDDLDPNEIYDQRSDGLPYSLTQYLAATATPKTFDLTLLEAVDCSPGPAARRPDYEQFQFAVGDKLVRRAEVVPPMAEDPSVHSMPYFELASLHQENTRVAMMYDQLIDFKVPIQPDKGSIWYQFPDEAWWAALAPKGQVRNTKGRVAAIAYREHGNEAFWYKVYSYDENGRIEAVMRLNDNLPYDATWYEFDNAGNPTKITTIDPIRHHTTWYQYDNEGRVEKMWSDLSADGEIFGLSLTLTGTSTPTPRHTLITFVTRPATPDVIYEYDALDRLVKRTYPNVDGGGANRSIETTWTFDDRGNLTDLKTEETAYPPVYLDLDFTLDAAGRVTAKDAVQPTTIADWTYDFDSEDRLIEADDQAFTWEWVLDNVSKRENAYVNTNLVETYDVLSTNTANGYSAINPFLATVDPQIDLDYDESGRLVERTLFIPTAGSGSNTSVETYRYGAQSQVTSMDQRFPLLTACPKGTLPDTAATYTEFVVDPGDPHAEPPVPPTTEPQEVWTYRYGPSGVREQRRLMQSSAHDSVGSGCSTVFPWTYYVNDPSGLVLAVYHGRQEARLAGEYGETTCDLDEISRINPLQQDPNVRRVYFYPVEYRSYGLTGVNVVYERDPNGEFVKRFVTLDVQGSAIIAQSSVGPTPLSVYDTEQDYLPFGEEVTAGTRRTGWLDREVDWETSPLDDGLRTVDLVHRRYTPHSGSFNTPDPLWALSMESSSYHYGNHDPVNVVDPWGLNGEKLSNPLKPNPKPPVTGPPDGVPAKIYHGVPYLLPFAYTADELRARMHMFEFEKQGLAIQEAIELDKNMNPDLYRQNSQSKLNSLDKESDWIKPSWTYKRAVEVDQYSYVAPIDLGKVVGTSAYAIGAKSTVQTNLVERIATTAAKSERSVSTYLGGLKRLGRVSGVVGVGISVGSIYLDISDGKAPDPWDVADTVVGVVALAVPGFGGIALVYFGARLLYEVTSGGDDDVVAGRP